MKKLLIILIFMSFLTSSVMAQKVKTLYEAEIPVSSQSEAERSRAIKQGLIEVLTKVTGTSQTQYHAVVQAILKNKPDYFLEEYSYGASSEPNTPYVFKATYDAKAIKRLLKNTGIPYWNNNRPLILVWLALTVPPDQPEIMGNDAPGNLPFVLKQTAQKQGIPLIFPMMDVMDMDQVSVQDVLASSLPVLKNAAKRYTPDALLIGKMAATSAGFQGQWELILDESHWQWTLSSKTVEDMMVNVMENMTHTLAKQYAVAATNTSTHPFTLVVTHITQRSDLVTLIRFLKQLTPVQQVQLAQISSDEVELSVHIHGSLEAFQQNAMLSQHLINRQEELANNKLIYEWVP